MYYQDGRVIMKTSESYPKMIAVAKNEIVSNQLADVLNNERIRSAVPVGEVVVLRNGSKEYPFLMADRMSPINIKSEIENLNGGIDYE